MRIPEQIAPFLGRFIIRKVLGGPEIADAAGPVTLELLEWLECKGYLKGRAVAEAKEQAQAAAESLPRAEKLSAVLYQPTKTRVRGRVVEDLDLEDEVVTISKVEPGRLWFTDSEGDEIGPLAVPAGAAELAQVGWKSQPRILVVPSVTMAEGTVRPIACRIVVRVRRRARKPP